MHIKFKSKWKQPRLTLSLVRLSLNHTRGNTAIRKSGLFNMELLTNIPLQEHDLGLNCVSFISSNLLFHCRFSRSPDHCNSFLNVLLASEGTSLDSICHSTFSANVKSQKVLWGTSYPCWVRGCVSGPGQAHGLLSISLIQPFLRSWLGLVPIV